MDPIEFQKQLQARVAAGHGVKELVQGFADQAHDRARMGARINSAVMGVSLSAFAVVLLALAAGSAAGALNETPNLTGALGFTLGALVAGAAGGWGLFLFMALRPAPRELIASGAPARLTVRDYRSARGSFTQQTRSGSFSFQRVAIDLDVQPSEGPAYSVTVYEYPPMSGLGALRPGAALRGYVDRAKPSRVYIDWAAVT